MLPGVWIHQCGSVAEARAAHVVGADGVIVQGVEAGGHVRETLPAARASSTGSGRRCRPTIRCCLPAGSPSRADVARRSTPGRRPRSRAPASSSPGSRAHPGLSAFSRPRTDRYSAPAGRAPPGGGERGDRAVARRPARPLLNRLINRLSATGAPAEAFVGRMAQRAAGCSHRGADHERSNLLERGALYARRWRASPTSGRRPIWSGR